MSERARTLSMFVVQRTFTRVRRGYDPEEVDRHLQLVRDWFTSTEVGEAIAHERTRLTEREAGLAAREQSVEKELHGARVEGRAILEGARRRADAHVRDAEQALAQARAEAASVIVSAQQERDAILDPARAEAAAAEVLTQARLEADDIVAAARAEAAAERAKLLEQAKAEAHRYLDRRRREADRLVRSARRDRGISG